MLRVVPIAFMLTLFLPPALYVASPVSSVTTGLLLCAVGWILVTLATSSKPYMLRKSDGYLLGMIAVVIALMAIHAFISNRLTAGVSFSRFATSCVILTFTVVGARFAARKLADTPTVRLVEAADLTLGLLALLGIAALLGVPAIGAQASAKSVVIFAEPSHFALACIPVLMFRVSIAKRSTQLLLIGAAMVFALFVQSLILLAGTLLVAFVLLRRTHLILMTGVLAAVAVTLDVTYYSSRLVFSADTDNLSALVLMQGWENAILAFRATASLGVGFQQLGIAGPIGDTAEKIFTLLGGTYINLRDGGSTAAKLIGEFGVLGMAILAFLLRKILGAIKQVRRAQLLPAAHRDVRKLFYCSMIISFAVELFLRGTGYFSPGSFLAFIALTSLPALERSKQGLMAPGTVARAG